MIRSQLNSYSGADPIWGFIALIGSERYTGEAAVGIDPRVRLFAVDGRVYFAEREGDAPIGTRLVNCGAVSTTQLEAGVVQIGETTSLARLFQRQPTIDRDAVELTIDLATESLLESIASKAVGMPEVFPLRHHSSGVHHWLRSAASTPAALPTAEAPVAAELATDELVPDQFVVEAFIAEELPVAEELLVAEEFVVEDTFPVENFVAADSVEEQPVIEDIVPVPAVAAWSAELLADPAPPEWSIEPTLDEPADDTPEVEETVAVPVAAVALPTLSSFSQPAVEEVHAEEAHAEEAPAEEAPAEEAPAEEAPEPVVAQEVRVSEPMLAPMPTFASLTLPPLPSASASEPALAGTPHGSFASLPDQPALAPVNPYEPGEQPAGLPKLASAPISMSDLAAANAAPTTQFAGPTHNLAAVDIWELVDVLTDEGHDDEQELVGSGASEKRGRTWLRGKRS